MKRKINFIGIIFGFLALNAQAQYNANHLYFTNPFRLNPSLMGQGSGTNIFAHVRNQYAGFRDGPVDQNFTFDHAFNDKNFALGGRIYSDRAGILRNTGFEFAYAYSINFENDWRLNFGLSAKLEQVSADIDQAIVEDPTEISLQQNWSSGLLFDGNVGLSLKGHGWTLSLAVPQLMQSSSKLNDDVSFEYLKFQQRRSGLLYVSYDWKLSNHLVLQPSVFSRYTGNKFEWNTSMVAHIKEVLILGGGYHAGYAVSATAGVKLKNGLMLVYNYSVPTNEIGQFSSGHELAFGYSFSLGAQQQQAKSRKMGAKIKTANIEREHDVERKFLAYDLQAIKQKEEIAILKALMNGNDLEADLDSLKAHSASLLDSTESSGWMYNVMGSFTSLQNANEYQQALLRYDHNVSTKTIQAGKFYFVYQTTGRDKDKMRKKLMEENQSALPISKAWIYTVE